MLLQKQNLDNGEVGTEEIMWLTAPVFQLEGLIL